MLFQDALWGLVGEGGEYCLSLPAALHIHPKCFKKKEKYPFRELISRESYGMRAFWGCGCRLTVQMKDEVSFRLMSC